MAIDLSSFFGIGRSPNETAAGKRSMLAESQTKGLGRIGVVEKKVAINAEKITSLKNIIKSRISNEKGGGLKDALQDQEATIFKINHNVGGILEALKAEREAEEDLSDEERQDKELAKRKKKEDEGEKPKKIKTPGIIKKMVAPIKSLWEQIVDTFMILFGGWAIDKIIKWVQDPKNEKTIEEIKEFITVALPGVIKGVLAIIALDIGLKVFGFVKMLAVGAGQLLSGLIGLSLRIKTWAMTNPWLAAGIGLAAVGVGLYALGSGDATGEPINSTGPAAGMNTDQRSERLQNIKEGGATKEAVKTINMPSNLTMFSGGGLAKGSDTVPAMLTPGEFIMSKGAVQEYGEDTLAGMNAAAGGTNLPKRANGITYAAGGGGVGGVRKVAGPMIKDHEGFRSQIYKDTQGNNTIGYGHLVLDHELERFKNGITKEQAEDLFDKDYLYHAKAAAMIPGFGRASTEQKAALIDLTYNMGAGWDQGFPKFRKAFSEGRYNEAANELVNSDWYNQVARRGPVIVNMIRGDQVRGSQTSLDGGAKRSAGQLMSSPPGSQSQGGTSQAILNPATPPPLPPPSPPEAGSDDSQPLFSPIDTDNFSSVVIKSLYGVVD